MTGPPASSPLGCWPVWGPDVNKALAVSDGVANEVHRLCELEARDPVRLGSWKLTLRCQRYLQTVDKRRRGNHDADNRYGNFEAEPARSLHPDTLGWLTENDPWPVVGWSDPGDRRPGA